MAYFDPWDEDEQWLPRRQQDAPYPENPVDNRMAEVARLRFATPPFLPTPPPVAPLDAPRRTSPAFDALAESVANQPLRSDPRYAPSKTRRVLGGLAGAALAAGEGWVNASGRTRINSNGGAALADNIVNAKFNKANRDFNEKQAVLRTQAEIEQARANDRRREAESGARIKSESAQEAAANAARDRANRIETPKPIEHDPAKDLVLPDGTIVRAATVKATAVPQTIDQYINQIRLDPTMTDEVKEERIKQRLADHNAAHPTRPVSPTAAGLAVAAAKGDAEAAKALKVLGTYNDKPTASGGTGGGSPSNEDTKTADAIIHGTMKLTDVTTKGNRRERVAALVDARRGEMAPKLTPKQKDSQDKMNAIDAMIDQLEATYTTKGDLPGVGPVAGSGVGQFANEKLGIGDAAGVDNRSILGGIGAELIHEKYGSALSKGENERAKTFIPGPTDPPRVVIRKLRQLKKFHEAKRNEWTGGKQAGANRPKVGDIRTGPDGKEYRITAIRGEEVDAEPVQP
jgi:hypothetical protein